MPYCEDGEAAVSESGCLYFASSHSLAHSHTLSPPHSPSFSRYLYALVCFRCSHVVPLVPLEPSVRVALPCPSTNCQPTLTITGRRVRGLPSASVAMARGARATYAFGDAPNRHTLALINAAMKKAAAHDAVMASPAKPTPSDQNH